MVLILENSGGFSKFKLPDFISHKTKLKRFHSFIVFLSLIVVEIGMVVIMS